jgi:hypothetical protein
MDYDASVIIDVDLGADKVKSGVSATEKEVARLARAYDSTGKAMFCSLCINLSTLAK